MDKKTVADRPFDLERVQGSPGVKASDFYDQMAGLYHLIFQDWDASIERQARQLSNIIRAAGGRASALSSTFLAVLNNIGNPPSALTAAKGAAPTLGDEIDFFLTGGGQFTFDQFDFAAFGGSGFTPVTVNLIGEVGGTMTQEVSGFGVQPPLAGKQSHWDSPRRLTSWASSLRLSARRTVSLITSSLRRPPPPPPSPPR
jgi:hypothetical protein